MILYPLIALGMAASMIPWLPLALFVREPKQREPSIRCSACEANACGECHDLNAERDRRFRVIAGGRA